ncbi:hypothetical protein ACC862_24160 [Rhizobium ruizarguesonis]
MTKRKLIGVSVRDFAESLGVTYEAVMKRTKAGKFSPDAFHEDGSLDEEVARVDWFANTNPNRTQAKPGDRPKPPRKNAAQHGADAEEKRGEFLIKLERAEVALEKERIELANLKRTHMPADEARRAVRTMMRMHRDHMLNFANRHGPAIAAEVGVSAAALVGLLEARIRDALNDAADQPLPFDTPPAVDGSE